ncbi:MAG: NnrS family protein, partial [Candidatus Manganitrophaceae bacterium]
MPAPMKLQATWEALASAPHRLFFLGGACQGVASVLWWLLDLSGRFAGFYPSPSWTIPPVWAHAYLMIYGFFPFFIFGFLFTFLPNWLDAERLPSRHYLSSFFATASGTVLFYVGLIFDKSILLLAVLLILSGWGMGAVALLRMLLPARSPEKVHLSLIVFFVIFGEAGSLSFCFWLLTNRSIWLDFTDVV